MGSCASDGSLSDEPERTEQQQAGPRLPAGPQGVQSSILNRTEVSEHQVHSRILRRHPPLEHHAARACHRERVAVPTGFRRIAGQRAVRAVVADKLL